MRWSDENLKRAEKNLNYNKTMLKEILVLAWPTVIEEGMHTGVQYISTAMVGRVGAEASAAVGLTLSTVWLMTGSFTALGMGVLSCIAKAIGAKDYEKAKIACTQAVIIALISGIIIGAISVGISPFLPRWLGAKPDIERDAFLYFFVTSIPMVFRAASSILGATLRATGNTKTPMQVSTFSIICNIILNYILINAPQTLSFGSFSINIWGAGLGVLGAAIASAICFCLNGVLMFLALCRSPYFSIRDTKISICKPVMGECMKVGLPIAGQRAIIHLGHVVFTALISQLGTTAIATHSIALAAEEAFYIPGYGMQAAAATFAGNAVGEKNAKKLREVCLTITLITIFIMTILSILLFVFPSTVMRFFTKDTEVIARGAVILRIVAVSEPLFAVSIIMEGIFNGIGDVKAPFIISVLSMWMIRLSFTYLCVVHLYLGLNAVWICMVADNVIRCILLLIRFFRRNWDSYINSSYQEKPIQ